MQLANILTSEFHIVGCLSQESKDAHDLITHLQQQISLEEEMTSSEG
jgi:hypothetical protein